MLVPVNIVVLCEDVRRTTSFEVVPILKRLSNLAFLLQWSSIDGGGGDDRGNGDDRADTMAPMSADDATDPARHRFLRWTMIHGEWIDNQRKCDSEGGRLTRRMVNVCPFKSLHRTGHMVNDHPFASLCHAEGFTVSTLPSETAK